MAYHIPVLLNECIKGLNINPEGVYVDATFGGGGHCAVPRFQDWGIGAD